MLIAANDYMASATDQYFDLSEAEQRRQLEHNLQGMENVQDVYRLLLMNLYLHKIESREVRLGDTLSPDHVDLEPADLILTNPPFGPAGGKPTRDDLSVTAGVSSYQLPFVEHCLRGLKSGGRAAIVVPDNVLFEDGRGRALRRKLMDEAALHTILRLPTGIFYAQGVKTNIIFLHKPGPSSKTRGASGATQAVWVYDLRTNMPAFGKTAPLRPDHLAEFVSAYGEDPNGGAARVDGGETGRFDRAAITARGDNLDITWLREERDAEDTLTEPSEIAAAIMSHLKTALAEIEALVEELEPEMEAAPVLEAAE